MCAVHLTGKADFYGPSYDGHPKRIQRPQRPLYDRSIYLPDDRLAAYPGLPVLTS